MPTKHKLLLLPERWITTTIRRRYSRIARQLGFKSVDDMAFLALEAKRKRDLAKAIVTRTVQRSCREEETTMSIAADMEKRAVAIIKVRVRAYLKTARHKAHHKKKECCLEDDEIIEDLWKLIQQ